MESNDSPEIPDRGGDIRHPRIPAELLPLFHTPSAGTKHKVLHTLLHGKGSRVQRKRSDHLHKQKQQPSFKMRVHGWLATQLSSVHFLDLLGRQGDMRDNSAEILFQPFLQEAVVSSSGMGGDVHFLTLSIQHFFCRPWHCPSSKRPRRKVLERLSRLVTCPNHVSFHL